MADTRRSRATPWRYARGIVRSRRQCVTTSPSN
jgi:hypothetical protein